MLSKKSHFFISIILFVSLSACTPSVVTSKAVISAETVLSTPTMPAEPTEWLPFNPDIVNNDECEKLVYTTTPVAATEDLTHEEIAQSLFTLYLAKHLALPPHHFCKLKDYRIEKINKDSRIDFLAQEQGVDFVDWIVYSIQIDEIPSSWVAANGQFAENGWITNKSLIIGVSKVNDQYILKLIGTGP